MKHSFIRQQTGDALFYEYNNAKRMAIATLT